MATAVREGVRCYVEDPHNLRKGNIQSAAVRGKLHGDFPVNLF